MLDEVNKEMNFFFTCNLCHKFLFITDSAMMSKLLASLTIDFSIFKKTEEGGRLGGSVG